MDTGVDINVVNKDGENLLFKLIESWNYEFERFIIPIEFGIDLNFIDNEGVTILFCVFRNFELLKYLLEHGCNPNIGTDEENKTSLETKI